METATKEKRARQRLTKRFVDALPDTGRDYAVYDSDLTGFGLRVLLSGRRIFFAQYRIPGLGRAGRPRRLTLGEYGRLTVEEARAEAKRVLGRVANGADPLHEKAKRREDLTVSGLAKLFLEDRARRKKERTIAEYRRLMSTIILPALGARSLRTVQRADVRALHARLADTPAVANNVIAILGAMFRFAEDAELFDGQNPCRRVPKYELASRRKSLTREQYGALGAAFDRAVGEGLPVPEKLRVQKRGVSRARRAKLTGRVRGSYKRHAKRPAALPANPISVAALRFLALSGWREQEALRLRWDELDASRGVAVLSDTKTGRSARPLGKAALDVLLEQKRHEGNPYVFVGAKKGAHLQDAKRVWIAAKEAAGVECRLHDLRHSFTTVGRELGYADYVIAKLVGHAVGGMTSRYGDVPDETVKMAADSIALTISRRLCAESSKTLHLTHRLKSGA